MVVGLGKHSIYLLCHVGQNLFFIILLTSVKTTSSQLCALKNKHSEDCSRSANDRERQQLPDGQICGQDTLMKHEMKTDSDKSESQTLGQDH